MNAIEQMTIGEYVAEDFRTAAVFSKYGIDFCCKGHRTLEEVCDAKGMDISILQNELSSVLNTKGDGGIDFKSWPTDLLIDYIEKTHHRYVEEKTPTLLQFLDKLCKVHGNAHPELFEIYDLFKGCAGELAQHIEKRRIYFVSVYQEIGKGNDQSQKMELPPNFGTVDNPIAMMKHEHDAEGERFRRIVELTNNYTPTGRRLQHLQSDFRHAAGI